MTVADSVADEAGGADLKTLAMRFAEILNAEARDLVDAGADVVQFDEPCFNIYLDEVAAWGIEALEQAMDGVAAPEAVHICYGYGTPVVLAVEDAEHRLGALRRDAAAAGEVVGRSGVGRDAPRRAWTWRCSARWPARTCLSASSTSEPTRSSRRRWWRSGFAACCRTWTPRI